MISFDELNKSHANYLREPLQPDKLKDLVEKAAQVINEKFPDCEYICGMGISGLAILSAVSYKTGKKMFILRKSEDINNHSFIGWDLTNKRKNEYYPSENGKSTAIVIDDLISTGNTMKIIYDRLFDEEILLEGIILYCDGTNDIFYIDNMEIPVYSIGQWEE